MSTPPGDNLVATLVQANYSAYASTTQALIRYLQGDAALYRAERDLIREAVTRLLSGPYAPSERMLARALYPDGKAVEARAAGYLEESTSLNSQHQR